MLERLICQGLSQTLQIVVPDSHRELETAVEGIERLIALGYQLRLPLALYRVQELYYDFLTRAQFSQPELTTRPAAPVWNLLMRLGYALRMDAEAVGAQPSG